MTFQKGRSGNPKGQLRAKPVREALDVLLTRAADDPLTDAPKTKAQKLALSLMHDAESQDYKIRCEARSELIDRTEGKAIQALEHSGHIARTHEEELAALDNPDADDTAREGDTPPAA